MIDISEFGRKRIEHTTSENFQHLASAFANQRPFRPYTLELSSGSRIDVNHPEALTIGNDGVVVCTSTRRVRNAFEAIDVVRFITVTGT